LERSHLPLQIVGSWTRLHEEYKAAFKELREKDHPPQKKGEVEPTLDTNSENEHLAPTEHVPSFQDSPLIHSLLSFILGDNYSTVLSEAMAPFENVIATRFFFCFFFFFGPK
jgi:hypothetical protein